LFLQINLLLKNRKKQPLIFETIESAAVLWYIIKIIDYL